MVFVPNGNNIVVKPHRIKPVGKSKIEGTKSDRMPPKKVTIEIENCWALEIEPKSGQWNVNFVCLFVYYYQHFVGSSQTVASNECTGK